MGPLTATAIVASVGDAREFVNGRQFAAWLGIVPRQHASGGKATLLGMSKRGDKYLRTLLIAVAQANKTARIIRAMLAHDRQFESDFQARRLVTAA